MKTQSRDTHPDAERAQIALLRRATTSQRAQLAFSLSRAAIELARRAIRRANPEASDWEVGLIFVGVHYGDDLAERLRTIERREVIMAEANLPGALAPVVAVLEGLGVAYFVGGSVASSIYGAARTTIDVDVVALLKMEHAQPFADQLGGDYYVDEAMVADAIRRRGSFNLIHLPTMLKIDMFIPKGEPYEKCEFRRIRQDTLTDTDERLFWVASPEDVVLRKLVWYRAGGEVSERQWSDAVGVLKVQGKGLDLDYMWRWGEELGVGDLLERAFEEASM